MSGTRVRLDTIITAFLSGGTPEAIAQKFPSVPLLRVYLVIGYHLTHTAEIDAYLSRQQAEAEALQREIEVRFDPNGIRARLMAHCKVIEAAKGA